MTRALLALLVLAAAAAEAGMPKPLHGKVFEADLIIEFELRFDAATMRVPDKTTANAVYPGGPLAAALERATPVRLLLAPPGVTLKTRGLPKPRQVAGTACLPVAAKRGTVKLLGFFKREKKGWEALFGIESMLPAFSDLDPQWPALVAAVEAALRWRAGAEPAPVDAKEPWLASLSYAWRNRSAAEPLGGAPPSEPAPMGCD